MTEELSEPAKVDLETPDLAAANRAAFEQQFPGVLADGVVDAERLKELLDVEVVGAADERERYGLMWAGKKEAVQSLQTPSRGTLIPDFEASVDWDSAQNVFIEGDNLEVLKLLQKAYNDQVRVIYIDPPYNTGKDFVYGDDYRDSLRAYLEFSGQVDVEGNQVAAAADTNGRHHSRWASMMHPRLMLARNLLMKDGVLFVSIDDNEVAQLRLILDEVFGPENFIENYVWESSFRPDNSSGLERENSQHILCYARSKKELGRLVGAQKKTDGLPSLTKNSMKVSTLVLEPDWVDFTLEDGEYEAGDKGSGYVLGDSVKINEGKAEASFRLSGRMIWSQEYLEQQVALGARIVIKGDSFVPYSKKSETSALAPTSLIPRSDVGDVLAGNAELRALFGEAPFNHPKPTTLIKYLVNAVTHSDKSALILDFFAGSGSTAHGVAALNVSDGGQRRTISINLPEPVAPESKADLLGFDLVSEITEARIKRVMETDPQFNSQGLRVARLAPSHFRVASRSSKDGLLDLSESTLAESAESLESVAQEVLLKEGVRFDAPWKRHEVAGVSVVVAAGAAVVLSRELTQEIADAALALRPKVVVFFEDGFAGADAVKANTFTNAKNANIVMKTV